MLRLAPAERSEWDAAIAIYELHYVKRDLLFDAEFSSYHETLSGSIQFFHEASHSLVLPDYGAVADAIDAAAKRANRQPPDQLWHAVIFYTAGRLAQKLYVAAGEQPYEGFADRAGLWRGDWAKYREALGKALGGVHGRPTHDARRLIEMRARHRYLMKPQSALQRV